MRPSEVRGDDEGMCRDQMIGSVELAEHLGVPEATVKQWRYLGTGPRFYKIGRHVRYDWTDVEAWKGTQSSRGENVVGHL